MKKTPNITRTNSSRKTSLPLFVLAALAAALVFAAILVPMAMAADFLEGSVKEDSATESTTENTTNSATENTEEESAEVSPSASENLVLNDTNIADLGAAEDADGNIVQIVGEAVGDKIVTGFDKEHCWILISSTDKKSNAAISVYMTMEDAEKIENLGRYGIKGTSLRVKGVFHLICPEHNGIRDLHAESISVFDQGRQTKESFSKNIFIPGGVAVAIGFVLLLFYYRIRERRR
ncbi:MAG: hydrolase [Eggerthellaceae bacterium]|jgi:hypothetical protein|nr:hydrolase [Eggerthellaceae bacterium]